MELIKKSFWTGLSSGFFAFYTLISNKLFSVYFGPQGVTLLAHFQNLIAIFTVIPNEGINRGLIKFLSFPHIKNEQWKNYFFAGLILNLIFFLFLSLLLVAFENLFFNAFPPNFFTPLNISIILGGVLIHICSLFFISLFLTSQQIKVYALLSVLNNILGIAIIWMGVIKGITQALLLLSVSPGISLIFILYFFWKSFKHRLSGIKVNTNWKSINEIGHFILSAVSVVVFTRISDFILRQFFIQKYSAYETGLWQATIKLSDGYTTLFTTVLGILIFSKISSLINDRPTLKAFLKKSLNLVVFASFTGLFLVYLLKVPILTLLFSEEFEKGAHLMDFLLVADLFKFPSLILLYLLQVRMKTVAFISIQALSLLIYMFFIFLLMPLLGFEGVQLAGLIKNLLTFLILLLINRHFFI